MFEELDFVPTSRGELSLRRRTVPLLENEIVYEVILNGEFLMSSLFHRAEEALAELAMEALQIFPEPLDVVVGGLGLGYTAAAALKSERVSTVLVVDVFPEIISWHTKGLVPMGKLLTEDPRCELIEGDFFALSAGNGFDSRNPGRRFHAVLLDIDHTPSHWLHPNHSSFYTRQGLDNLKHHLLPGGVFAMWADGLPEVEFQKLLNDSFTQVRAVEVSFPNPIRGGESSSAVYLAINPD